MISKTSFTPASEIKGGPRSVNSSNLQKTNLRTTSTGPSLAKNGSELMTLNVPGIKSVNLKGSKPNSREKKEGQRDDSPNLSADQISNDFSSA